MNGKLLDSQASMLHELLIGLIKVKCNNFGWRVVLDTWSKKLVPKFVVLVNIWFICFLLWLTARKLVLLLWDVCIDRIHHHLRLEWLCCADDYLLSASAIWKDFFLAFCWRVHAHCVLWAKALASEIVTRLRLVMSFAFSWLGSSRFPFLLLPLLSLNLC